MKSVIRCLAKDCKNNVNETCELCNVDNGWIDINENGLCQDFLKIKREN